MTTVLPDRECVEAGECRPPHRSGKDTKRWCRGRVGAEHDWQWIIGPLKTSSDTTGEMGYRNERLVCAVCDRDKPGKNARRRCHCGAVMVPPADSRRRWYSFKDRGIVCASCDYEPYDFRMQFCNGDTPRQKCKCEIETEKFVKREQYGRRFR